MREAHKWLSSTKYFHCRTLSCCHYPCRIFKDLLYICCCSNINVVLFSKGFLFPPLTFFLFRPRPCPMRVGCEWFYCIVELFLLANMGKVACSTSQYPFPSTPSTQQQPVSTQFEQSTYHDFFMKMHQALRRMFQLVSFEFQSFIPELILGKIQFLNFQISSFVLQSIN